ncbi:hypothetical protein AAFA46_00890 [Oscillospiraceae bacterium WX1]
MAGLLFLSSDGVGGVPIKRTAHCKTTPSASVESIWQAYEKLIAEQQAVNAQNLAAENRNRDLTDVYREKAQANGVGADAVSAQPVENNAGQGYNGINTLEKLYDEAVHSKGTEGTGDGLNKAGIPKTKVDEILKSLPGSRPNPKTYLSKEYIANHLGNFNNGVTKIKYKAPTGFAGPPDGTFVMPSSVANDLIAKANGDISKLEQLLGLAPGSLGKNPVRVDIANPTGLRMPSGNEFGANAQWVPGGYTSGKIPEIIIDSPAPGQYIVRPLT